MFEIIGQAGVFAVYPNGATMALGSPSGWKLFFEHVCAVRRAKEFPFSPGAKLGGFGLLRNVAKLVFKTMGQVGVFPAMRPHNTQPDSATHHRLQSTEPRMHRQPKTAQLT